MAAARSRALWNSYCLPRPCRRWPAPQTAHIGPSPPPRLGARVRPARRARGVTRTRLHSLALCRPRLRRKPRHACTRGMDFLPAEKRRCPANRRNVSAERADVGNLPTCVHARWAFWHPRSCTGASCPRPRPACTHGTRFPTRGRSWPPVNRGDAPTGQDHVRSLVLCVHAGRTFCRWEGLGGGWMALLPCGQAPRVKDDRRMLPPTPATRR